MSDAKRAMRKSGKRQPWYTSGLRFTCLSECGACCTQHDNHAYVYLEGDDAPKLSEHLGLSEQEFKNEYTVVDDGDLVLRMDEPGCPFLDGWRCSVYQVRPTQCRTFPFWKEALESRAAWRRLRTFCPGVDEGDVHSLETIRRHLEERERD